MGKFAKSNLKSLVSTLKKQEEETSNNNDGPSLKDRFFKPTLDKKDSETEYIIRFLPNPDSDEGFPWILRHQHMFEFPATKNYVVVPCPKRHKHKDADGNVSDCPFCEEVKEAYDSDNETKISQIGRPRNAKKRYLSNVLVVKDPRDGGKNEGKVMLFEYGPQVQDLLMEDLEEQAEERKGYTFFDIEDGADFKLKVIRKGVGESSYPNYEKSKFINTHSALANADGDEYSEKEVDDLYDECMSLNEEFMKDTRFKSYEEMVEILKKQGYVKSKASSEDGEEVTKPKPKKDDEEETTKPAKEEKKKVEKPVVEDDDDDDSDDDLDDLLADL